MCLLVRSTYLEPFFAPQAAAPILKGTNDGLEHANSCPAMTVAVLLGFLAKCLFMERTHREGFAAAPNSKFLTGGFRARKLQESPLVRLTRESPAGNDDGLIQRNPEQDLTFCGDHPTDFIPGET